MLKYKKIIMVDMTCSILHHGHIRILKKASKFGEVIVALTSDEEILKHKKFKTLLNFAQRKEILLSIKYVSKVIKSQYLITDSFIKANKCDYLFHGSDTQNNANLTNLKTIKRTKSISSTALRNFNKLTIKKIKEIFSLKSDI